VNTPLKHGQQISDGRVAVGALPPRTAPVDNPVIEVINEQTGELIYARRSATADVNAPVYDLNATYTLKVSDPDSGYVETFTAQQVQ